jgi:A/G-specific adenine glycosylase
MRAIMPPSLTDQLFAWYGQQARDLPWRATRDPYAIWVAEVMLQQTRVATVVPYYQRWLDRFPTMEHLAAASQDDVLNAWEGLGYYRRAHNLQQAVRLVVDQHAGRLPTTSGELRRLPGIGPYTAAAIAAIAFGRDEIAVDGNLRRVIARLFDLDAPLGSAEAEQAIAGAAARLLPPGRAGDFNQALMDLGALICTPANPECPSCPLQAECLARQRGTQHQRPVRPTKGVLPTVERITAVILRNGRYLVGRRPAGGLLGGLWEFPGGDLAGQESVDSALVRILESDLGLALERASPRGRYKHSYTHFRVTAHVYQCLVGPGEPVLQSHDELRWLEADLLTDVPMGKIDRTIAESLNHEDPKNTKGSPKGTKKS